MARVLIATDAWHPQVSGVVRTLDATARTLRDWGHAVEIVEPTPYWSVPFPFYPDVPMCLPRAGRIYERIARFRPDHVHIATEGGIGLVVRRFCRKMGWRFTSSYHTRFPGVSPAIDSFSRTDHVPVSEVVSWAIQRDHDRDNQSGGGTCCTRLQAADRQLVARGGSCHFSPTSQGRYRLQTADPALGRPYLAREGDRGLSAAEDIGDEVRGRRWPGAVRVWNDSIPMQSSSDFGTDRNWGRFTPPPICSSSRAGPIPSAWS